MEKIILVGGGGHCKSVIDVIELQNRYKVAGIVDKQEKMGQNILGYTVIATDNDLPELVKEYSNFHISLGFIKNNIRRVFLYNELCSLGANFPTIISPLSYISKYAKTGKGSIIMHYAQIGPDSIVGENVIINSKALIEHDCCIESNCHIATGAIINGDVFVGANSFIGSGSVVVNSTKVPTNTFIKANSLFIK
ncbi:MAG: NeuD/PglB/VioB family sugar acetyltransferase [Bacteroidetes bacterium]|nr:NeuD/PglB/VioB family sugar acetyltransferase [Bacteroidota bacterium]